MKDLEREFEQMVAQMKSSVANWGELSKDGAHTIQEERNISNSMNLGSETLYLGIQ